MASVPVAGEGEGEVVVGTLMLFVGQRGGKGTQFNCKWFGRWCREISPSSQIMLAWLGRLIGWMGMLTKGNEMGDRTSKRRQEAT